MAQQAGLQSRTTRRIAREIVARSNTPGAIAMRVLR
jgi:hypothetical protein